MKDLTLQPTFIYPILDLRRRELPCKDMDLDCLPGRRGEIPFGSYVKCYLYDPDKGSCPFLPF